jgi:hypothetical protein
METAAGATQRKIHYSLADVFTAGGSKTVYVDVLKDMSLCNHRLYRQGRVPMVRVNLETPLGTLGLISAQVLPNTWQVRKAHQLALREYLRATKEERRSTGQARWHDFKVWFDDGQRTGTTLTPVGITVGNSEWNYSEIAEEDDSTERRFKFIGSTDVNAFGMVAEYDSAPDVVDDDPPNPGGSSPYMNLNPDLQGKNADNLLDEGDFPPYNPDDLQVQLRTENIWSGPGSAVSNNKLTTGFMAAPCGLIKLETSIGSGDLTDPIGLVTVEVMPGDYKGIHATPMGLKL